MGAWKRMGDNFAADIAELASGLNVGDSDSVSGDEADDLYDHDFTMTEQELWEYEHPEGDAEEFAEHLRRRDGNVECQAHDLALPKKVIEGDKYGGLSLSKLAGAAIDTDEVVRQFTFKQVVDVMRSQGENPQKALLISFMTALVEEIQNDKKSSDARAELLLIESAKLILEKKKKKIENERKLKKALEAKEKADRAIEELQKQCE